MLNILFKKSISILFINNEINMYFVYLFKIYIYLKNKIEILN